MKSACQSLPGWCPQLVQVLAYLEGPLQVSLGTDLTRGVDLYNMGLKVNGTKEEL